MSLAVKENLERYKKSKDAPAIIHFANNPKPGGEPTVPWASEWWAVAKSGLYYEELLVRLINFKVQTFQSGGAPDNRSGARRLADKILPSGSKRRSLMKKLVPKGSLRWRFCKQVYYIFRPKYRPKK